MTKDRTSSDKIGSVRFDSGTFAIVDPGILGDKIGIDRETIEKALDELAEDGLAFISDTGLVGPGVGTMTMARRTEEELEPHDDIYILDK